MNQHDRDLKAWRGRVKGAKWNGRLLLSTGLLFVWGGLLDGDPRKFGMLLGGAVFVVFGLCLIYYSRRHRPWWWTPNNEDRK